MKRFPNATNLNSLEDVIAYLQSISALRNEDITNGRTQRYLLGRLRTDRTAPASESIEGGDSLGDVFRDGNNAYCVVNTGSAYEWRQTPLLLPGESNSSPVSILNINTTIVGNIGTGEDDLMTYTLPGGTLSANGDALEIVAFGPMTALTVTKKIKLYFGSTAISLLNASTNAVSWHFRGKIIRTGASTQNIMGVFSIPGTFLHISGTASETLANNVTIKFTGESTTTDYIQQNLMQIKLEKGA